MAETKLSEAIEDRGPYAVWDLMTEDEQREAAIALWENSDRESRGALEVALAKDLRFRPQSVRRLPAEKVAGRLVRLADSLPEAVLFQYLFHLHMVGRRPLMVSFLDSVGLPHDNGTLDLPEDFEGPDAAAIKKAAQQLIKAENHTALVYLSTLLVADADFWEALGPVLEKYAADGSKA